MNAPFGGTIISFYSYKGGAGRTMTLANVAWILASAGKRVLVIDWDLEAPGVHRYFRPFLSDPEMKASDGVIEMMMNYALAALTPGEQDPDWHLPFANVLQYVVSVEWDFPNRGTLDLMPAGRQDESYTRRIVTFNWHSFYERLGGGSFLEAVKRNLRAEYDYILIDGRTGLSDTAGIVTIQMPDALVACFTYTRQSVENMAAVLNLVLEQRQDARLRVFPVPTRVELAERARLDKVRADAMSRMAPLLRMRPEDIDTYWAEVEIPYVPAYAYAETLAPFMDRPGMWQSVLASTIRLTRYLTDGDVRELAPMPESERMGVLEQLGEYG
ncbi:MAG TPA: AAA family ATPase [Thermoanaerobaculia bacterium]|nr:AAA family ATPase [Thermoanaerobaculia bacterium]